MCTLKNLSDLNWYFIFIPSCCLASPIYLHTELLSLRDLFLVSRETVIIAPTPSLSCHLTNTQLRKKTNIFRTCCHQILKHFISCPEQNRWPCPFWSLKQHSEVSYSFCGPRDSDLWDIWLNWHFWQLGTLHHSNHTYFTL